MKILVFASAALGGTLPAGAYFYAPAYLPYALAAAGVCWGLFGILLSHRMERATRVTIITDAEGKIRRLWPGQRQTRGRAQ